MHRLLRRLVLLPSIAIALVVPAVAPAGALAASDFPVGWRAFHTYPEMVADIHAVAAAHPDIVRVFSIGQSYQGRQLWAAKVSDNVNTDENEPEVLFDGLHHSDEHMGLEMTLHILHWLADGYGSNTRITNIVNSREVWIIFAVNPDGATFDIKNGHFHFWRKNRQPTPGSSAIGTDLNRNYSYHWGIAGRTSRNPEAITYHGPKPFSAPETRAYRDFLASRVVGGRQQIRAAITFHEAGRLVMWPYGYTKKNVPADMTAQDEAALRKIGRHMARTNGYKPEQGSDLYITRGGSRDYLYGHVPDLHVHVRDVEPRLPEVDVHRARDVAQPGSRPLPRPSTPGARWRVLGADVRAARCGAFDDDLEVSRGWQVNPDGTDTAITTAQGRWARGNPAGTTDGGRDPAADDGAVGSLRDGHRAGGGLVRRRRSTSTAGRRSAPCRSRSPRAPASGSRSAGSSRTRRTRHRPTTCGRSWRRERRRRSCSSARAPRRWSRARGTPPRSR